MPDLETLVEPLLDLERLLAAIPGERRGGESLRYTPEYDRIRDGLRPSEVPASEDRALPAIDYVAVIRLASDVLAKKSKDLDVAVWLIQALVGEYGLPGLGDGLVLIRRLIDDFWDVLYPAIDSDGDEGFRAKPLLRLKTVFSAQFQLLPITNDGRTIEDFTRSRTVPSEEEAARRPASKNRREKAIQEGLPTPESVGVSIKLTDAGFYHQKLDEIREARTALAALQQVCNAKFLTRDRPSFEKLADQLDELQATISVILKKKPLPPEEPIPSSVPAPSKAESADIRQQEAEIPLVAALRPPTDSLSIFPASEAIFSIARSMRAESASNPVPYLLVRSWQFGRLLAIGSPIDAEVLEPPLTEMRMALRRAVLNNDWAEVLVQSERAMELPCGSCWLDIHFHAFNALTESGMTNAAAAIRAMLSGYLAELPELIDATMLDGSPTSSPEARIWLCSAVLDPQARPKESLDEVNSITDQPQSDLDSSQPDAFEVAISELNAGRLEEAVRIIQEASLREFSGRSKLKRKIQMAKLFVEAEKYRIALPILLEIWHTFEEKQLAAWEEPAWIAVPLTMLYRCLEKLDGDSEQKRQIYDRLCALDPRAAIQLDSES